VRKKGQFSDTCVSPDQLIAVKKILREDG
jgi:hypothetical protein